jgi:hypothetical protein
MSIVSEEINIVLLEERVSVWLSARAAYLRDNVYRVIQRPPPDEHWEFSEGEIVHCRRQTFENGRREFAAMEEPMPPKQV